MKHLCIEIKNKILDDLPTELSESYQGEYFGTITRDVNDRHFYQKDNFNSTNIFGDYSLPKDLFIELNILNKIIDNIRKL